jgi:hypothetical protein
MSISAVQLRQLKHTARQSQGRNYGSCAAGKMQTKIYSGKGLKYVEIFDSLRGIS